MTTTIAFTLDAKGTQTPLTLSITQGVIAGWTGRDPVARDHHIKELQELGIAPPASTPIYYRCSARRFTTSGEVEFCLFASGGTTYVGVGSDHTDRKVETYNITVSKQMCDKPVAPVLWELSEVIGHWDQIILRSWATIKGEKVLYQEGLLSGMLPVAELIKKGFDSDKLPDGTAMFGGTFAAKGGIRPASRFDYEIEDPVLKRKISHGYEIKTLPVVG
jgi:hypothetical protein